MHTNKDPLDEDITYSPKQLVEHLVKLGFDVAAITHHDDLYFTKGIVSYAKKKGLLLIPGMEMTLETKHTLLLNFTAGELKKIKTFADLRKIKKPHHLVVAPHPYYPSPTHFSLGEKLEEHIDLFDAVEHCHFYMNVINFNKKAKATAKKHGLPLIGNSDAHFLFQIGTNYTLVHAKKEKNDVISAIKKGKIKLVTKPLTIPYFIRVGLAVSKGLIKTFIKRLTH